MVDPLIEWIETPWADFVINQLPACHRVIRIGNQTNPDSRTKLKSGDDYTFCAQCMDSSEPILQRFFVCKNQVQFAQNAGSCCLRQAKWCEIHSRGLAPMSFCWNFLFPTQSTFAWTETLSKLNSYQKPEHHHYQLHHQHHRHHHHQRHHHHHNVKRYPTNYQCVRGSIENFCLWVFFYGSLSLAQ